MSEVNSYQDLLVWQQGMDLAAEVYTFTRSWPKDELYGLTQQARRASVSVPANIAEGHSRGTRKDYANFISIARGSLAETETILLLLVDVELLRDEQVRAVLELSSETGRMLNALLGRLRSNPDPGPLKPDP